LSIILILLVGTWIGGRITRPVNKLVEEARRLGRGDYAEPIAIHHRTQDELTILAEAFEDMRKDVLNRDQQLQMMLSGIAHEVRNPLGGMKIFAGLLEEDLRSEGDVDHLEKVTRIQRELTYLDCVVTDFLEFAREQPPALERFRAAELLSEIDDLLAAECAEAGTRLNIEVEPESVEITADRAKLRRAVINCVRNGYQACGEGGKVTVSVVEEEDVRLEEVDLVVGPEDAGHAEARARKGKGVATSGSGGGATSVPNAPEGPGVPGALATSLGPRRISPLRQR